MNKIFTLYCKELSYHYNLHGDGSGLSYEIGFGYGVGIGEGYYSNLIDKLKINSEYGGVILFNWIVL